MATPPSYSNIHVLSSILVFFLLNMHPPRGQERYKPKPTLQGPEKQVEFPGITLTISATSALLITPLSWQVADINSTVTISGAFAFLVTPQSLQSTNCSSTVTISGSCALLIALL